MTQYDCIIIGFIDKDFAVYRQEDLIIKEKI